MSAAPAVTPATLADLDALVALEEGAFAADRATRRALRHAILAPGITVLTTRQDGALTGAALIERRRGSRIARLTSIAVDPAHLGAGIGRRLLEAVEAEALAQGRDRLRLEVRAGNAAAIRLYERAGYRRFAVVPDYYEDGAPAWRYEKALGAPP